jgi:hypothetical protein
MNQTGAGSPCLKSRNQTVRFQKPGTLILSRPVAVKGAVEQRRGASPPTKRCLDDGEA